MQTLQSTPAVVALKKRLASTRSLTAKFTQKRHWAALKDTLVTEGTIQSDRSGKLVWRTEKPSANELTFDGKTATLKFPAVNTTQTFDLSAEPGMAKVFESITAVLKADLERLVPLYTVRILKPSPLSLELTPRNEAVASVVSKLKLDFNAASDLTGVVLDESGGDSTEITFKDHVLKTDAK
ncbi:MAG: LolA family protein [Myxococcaceae bacterium]